MGLPVVTVVAGGLPIVESTIGGTPVTEATNGYGVPVTKVVGKPGLPVVFETIGVGAPVTYATWNAGTGTNIALSGGNLTATPATNAAAAVRGSVSKSSGKYYFEMMGIGTSQNSAVGISTSSPGGTTIVPTLAAFINIANGGVFVNGSNVGPATIIFSSSNWLCVAVDLDNKRMWFRDSGSGIWNGNATFNPATNVGGFDISSVFASAAAFPIVTFTGTGLSHTANFGASAFVDAVPSGFTSGWPA